MKKIILLKFFGYTFFLIIKIFDFTIKHMSHFIGILFVFYYISNRPTELKFYDSILMSYPFKILFVLFLSVILYKPVSFILHKIFSPLKALYKYIQQVILQKYEVTIPILPGTYCVSTFNSNLVMYNICSFAIISIWLMTGVILENKPDFYLDDLQMLFLNILGLFLPILIIDLIIFKITDSLSTKKSIPNQNAYKKDKPENDVDSMSGQEFEQFCAQLLSANGFYNIQLTPTIGDQGIDIFATKDQIRYAIQCKRYSGKVGNKAVQEAFSGSSFYNCNQAVVLTNSYFSEPAKELACRTGVILWNRDVLIQLIENYQL